MKSYAESLIIQKKELNKKSLLENQQAFYEITIITIFLSGYS